RSEIPVSVPMSFLMRHTLKTLLIYFSSGGIIAKCRVVFRLCAERDLAKSRGLLIYVIRQRFAPIKQNYLQMFFQA
ncbi:hypothetical protein, partial [Cloacibacillus evryensis]